MTNTDREQLDEAREEFIDQWGSLGSSWGINRSMAQIHALLLVSSEASSTDDVMEALDISRGNANTNLRELVGWGLVRSIRLRGDRKEYFEAEKDVWKIVCTVARERNRREIEPALDLLRRCAKDTAKLKSTDARAFHSEISELADFVAVANGLLTKVVARERSQVVPRLLKLFS